MFCEKCGKEIDKLISFCPYCGSKIPEVTRVKNCPFCQEEILSDAIKCKHCRSMLTTTCQTAVKPQEEDAVIVDNIADNERISAIFWMVLSIIQILTVVAIIAGIWNFIGSLTKFSEIKKIRKRDASVPKDYSGVTGLIIIGFVNLFLGGVIGVAMVGFDFYIRSKVLKNAHLFTEVYEDLNVPVATSLEIPEGLKTHGRCLT